MRIEKKNFKKPQFWPMLHSKLLMSSLIKKENEGISEDWQ